MTALGEYLVAALLVLGGTFGLIGSFGALKLRDPMQRLHAPTKATTIGVGAALIAAALDPILQGQGWSWKEVLIAAFLFMTAPLSALYLAKTHLMRTVAPKTLPKTGTDEPWATLQGLTPAQQPKPRPGAKTRRR